MARRIVIVGSGVAGSMIAKHHLAKNADDRVIMLEAGAPVPMRERRAWMDFVTTGALPYADRYDRTEDFTSPDRIHLVRSRIFARGGTTLHWTGHVPRYKPEDFALKSGSGHEIDWPFSYETFAPYYARAEEALIVAGVSADNDPPRFGAQFPLEAPQYCAADGPVIAALESMNMRYSHLPSARSGRCVTTGTCAYCPVGGRYTGDMTLDELEGNARFELILNAPVSRVHLDGKKRVSGVTYTDMTSGLAKRVDGDIVILCAGAVETPKLLLSSADPQWKNGIGNDTGHVGRHVKNHVQLRAEGVISSNPKKLQQEIDIGTVQSRHYDTEAEQAGGKFQFTRPGNHPLVGLERRMAAGESAAAIDAAIPGPMTAMLLGYAEPFAMPENEIRLAPGTNRFGLPRTEIRFTEHEKTLAAHQRNLGRMKAVLERMGASDIKLSIPGPSNSAHIGSTCRMSVSPADGVVDPDLRVHGLDNLYVCSNAVLPNITAVNPTLTLVGLALRLTDHLAA